MTANAPTGTPHVVILIHGIRDYALWQNEIKHTLSDAGFVPQSTNYGRFDLLRFLIPISYFRNRAIEAVWTQIRDVRKRFPNAQYSVIAHSFGTYVFAQILKKGFDLVFHRVVFCGCILSYKFDFEQISERFTTPIVNDVGTRDQWPALAESVTWGYGSTGTYGFNRPRVEDRWHNGAHHGYFLSARFCKKYWIPFLENGTIVRAATKAESPRLWLRLLSLFRIKYFLVAAFAASVIAAWINLACRFDGTGYRLGSDGDPYFYWRGTITSLLQDVQNRCMPAKILGDRSSIIKTLACRRYVTIAYSQSDELKDIVSCSNFTYGGARSERDPLHALELLAESHPHCLSIKATSSDQIELRARTDQMTRIRGRWLCNCSTEQADKFSSLPPDNN